MRVSDWPWCIPMPSLRSIHMEYRRSARCIIWWNGVDAVCGSAIRPFCLLATHIYLQAIRMPPKDGA